MIFENKKIPKRLLIKEPWQKKPRKPGIIWMLFAIAILIASIMLSVAVSASEHNQDYTNHLFEKHVDYSEDSIATKEVQVKNPSGQRLDIDNSFIWWISLFMLTIIVFVRQMRI